MKIDQAKTEYNARAKAAMQEYLRSKSWEEKVRSIERMNVADSIAKESMRKALVEQGIVLPRDKPGAAGVIHDSETQGTTSGA